MRALSIGLVQGDGKLRLAGLISPDLREFGCSNQRGYEVRARPVRYVRAVTKLGILRGMAHFILTWIAMLSLSGFFSWWLGVRA